MNNEVQAEPNADEVLIHFQRFSNEKQDQVRALVNYATLMGLNGKDLVSIGGKLNRIQEKKEMTRNREIVEHMDIRRIGKDTSCLKRWAYTDALGTIYHFVCDYSRYNITNTKTKQTVSGYLPSYYPIKRFYYDNNRDLANVMLNVYHGDIKLP